MLDKSKILEGVKHKEKIVREEIYSYVCRFHSYDDEDINKALIKFIEEEYNNINFVGLIYSKLNKEIIECLVKILSKEKNKFNRERIIRILLEHYELIKDMEYDFEKELVDYDLLLYKKIKHFSNKSPKDLILQYERAINNLNNSDEETEDIYVLEILVQAIDTVLLQTKEGISEFEKYVDSEIAMCDNKKEFIYTYLPDYIRPLCKLANEKYSDYILELYFDSTDFLAHTEYCNYYFSNISSDKFVDEYINKLKKINSKAKEDYYYDVCEYLNSEKIDDFLFEELEECRDTVIKENIMRILCSKMCRKVIPLAMSTVIQNKNDEKLEIKLSLAPFLALENYEDDKSKLIIEDVKKYYSAPNSDMLSKEALDVLEILQNMREMVLNYNKDVKKYKKIRKLFDEIMQSMMSYQLSGKFELKFGEEKIKNLESVDISSTFDTTTELGLGALANVVVFKNHLAANCIAEEYLQKNKFRNQEKIELLNSMLESEAGLFEITDINIGNANVCLRNVLNNKQYCITDIGLSSNINYNKTYIYTRIITYKDISFGFGFNLVFDKTDPFIKQFIEENTKDYTDEKEIVRFMKLYNEYKRDDKGVRIKSIDVNKKKSSC